MRKLYVHVGFPKTGTTTIQSKLFYPLHLAGKINFLGRKGDIEGGGVHFPLRAEMNKLIYLSELAFEKEKKLIADSISNAVLDDHINEKILNFDDVFVKSSNIGIMLEGIPGSISVDKPTTTSFAEAFSEARNTRGPGAIFEWNGQSYTTSFAEEIVKPGEKLDSTQINIVLNQIPEK